MDTYYIIERVLRDSARAISVMEERPEEEAYWYIGYLLSALEGVHRDMERLREGLLSSKSMV
jgi:hypothetical protein